MSDAKTESSSAIDLKITLKRESLEEIKVRFGTTNRTYQKLTAQLSNLQVQKIFIEDYNKDITKLETEKAKHDATEQASFKTMSAAFIAVAISLATSIYENSTASWIAFISTFGPVIAGIHLYKKTIDTKKENDVKLDDLRVRKSKIDADVLEDEEVIEFNIPELVESKFIQEKINRQSEIEKIQTDQAVWAGKIANESQQQQLNDLISRRSPSSLTLNRPVDGSLARGTPRPGSTDESSGSSAVRPTNTALGRTVRALNEMGDPSLIPDSFNAQ